ncbi:MAG: MarR family transcriptional regulator [Deltaproteobacteria bacterium]|nr:MarR family transcriptional regulator [Deltaproteobacteria bacterium]
MDEQIIREQVAEYYALWNSATTIYDEYAKSLDLPYSGLRVLCCICSIHDAREQCTQKEISNRTLFPKQTVNVIVTGFLRQGLIELSETSSDRRVKAIRLTDAGEKYVQSIIPRAMRAEFEAMRKLSQEQREALISTTKIYMAHLRKCLFDNQ